MAPTFPRYSKEEFARRGDEIYEREVLPRLTSEDEGKYALIDMRDPNPIVDEVRAVRDAIAKKYDYDIAKIAEAVRAREAKSGRMFVRLPPRKPLPVRKAG